MDPRFRSCPRRLACLLLGVFLAGCGGGNDRSAVSGKVTFNGDPVEQGYLNFIPEGGGPSAGAAILKGEYKIGAEKGVVPGPNRVEIHATYKTGRMVPGINDPNELVDEWGELIPAKYHKDSPLKEQVAEGENTIDFKLEGESPAPKGSPKK